MNLPRIDLSAFSRKGFSIAAMSSRRAAVFASQASRFFR
jgi:hypothetical protein